MAEAKTPLRRLRSESTHFLGLKEEDTLPPGGLPTNKNVLEVILKQKASNKNTPVEKLVCCSLNKTFDTKCGVSGGCDPTSRCTVGQILERYSQAGIPSLKADKLKTSCIALFKLYRDDIKKHASRENPGDKVLEKRNAFVEKLGTLFKAFPDNVEDKIKADKKRTERDIADDLAFFADQKLDWPLRKMAFDSLDRRYVKAVQLEAEREARKRQRETDFQNRREREAERRKKSEIRVYVADLDMIIGPDNNNGNNNNVSNDDEEKKDNYLPTKEVKVGRKTGQHVFIPHDILAKSVPVATLANLSTGQHYTTVSGILSLLGCDLDKFTVSHSSSSRLRQLVNSKVAQKIKVQYTATVKEHRARIIIHYDGKLMEILGEFLVKKLKKDRVGILARSPDLPDDDREQLLGVPELASGTGELYSFH